MKTSLWRVFALALVVVSTSCSSKGPGESAPRNATGMPNSADTRSTPESLARLLAEIEDLRAKLPRDRTDPEAVVDPSRDPGKILAWVRENTRLVAYEGSLRGPLGVLMDRRGNSLDRALLLARLFEVAGHEARVVGGKLPSGDASKLLADGPAAAGAAASTQAGAGTLHSELKQQAATIATMIMAQTGPLTAATPLPESTHYWVQYNDGTRWADADPTLGDIGQARPRVEGQPLAVDPQTHGVARAAAGVPGADELMHSVTMRLAVERWEAGKLVESELAPISFDPADGPFAAATVSFVPVNQATGTAVQRVFANGSEFQEKLLGETAWALVLADDKGRTGMGRMFDDAGIVGDLPKGFDATGKFQNATGSGFGALAGGLGVDDTEAEAPTVLTALIADYEIRVPGRPVRQLRRYIFDSIGPQARSASGPAIPRPKWTDQQVIERGADLAALNDTLVSFASLSRETYASRYAQRLVDSKDAILKVIAGSADEATLQQAGYGLSFRTLELYAATRDSTMNPQLAIVEPQVFRRIIRFVPNTNAKALDVQSVGDLAWNRLGSVAGPASSTALVTQGVLDTLQESAIVLRDGPALPGQTTAALFEEAAKQGIEITTVRDAGDARLASFPDPARARMLEDLHAGQILVSPGKPIMLDGRPRLGWWRVDPNTGQVVGMMDTGLGQTMVSFAIRVQAVAGILLYKFIQVPAGPAAHAWARHMAQRAGDFSLYDQLLRVAAGFIYLTGRMPPW